MLDTKIIEASSIFIVPIFWRTTMLSFI